MRTMEDYIKVPFVLHLETKQDPIIRHIKIPYPECIRDDYPHSIRQWDKLQDCFKILICADFEYFYNNIYQMNDRKGHLTVYFNISSIYQLSYNRFRMMQLAWEECNESDIYVTAIFGKEPGERIVIGHSGYDIHRYFCIPK